MSPVNNNTDAYYQTAGDYEKVAERLGSGRFKIIDRDGELYSVNRIGFCVRRILKALGLYSGVLDLAEVKPRIQTFLDYGLRNGFEVTNLVEKCAAQRWFRDMRGEPLRHVICNLNDRLIEKYYANIFPLNSPEQQAETRARFELLSPPIARDVWKSLYAKKAYQYIDYFTSAQIQQFDAWDFSKDKDKFFSTSTPEEKAKTERLVAAMAPRQIKTIFSDCFGDKDELCEMLSKEQRDELYSSDRAKLLAKFSIPTSPEEIERTKQKIQALSLEEVDELFDKLKYSSESNSRDKMKFLIPILTPAQANKVFKNRIHHDKELCSLFTVDQIKGFDCHFEIELYLLSTSTPEKTEIAKKVAGMLTHKQLNAMSYTFDVKILLFLTDSQFVGIEEGRLSSLFEELCKKYREDALHLVERLSNPTINKVLPTLLKTRLFAMPKISATWLTPDQLRNLSPSMLSGLSEDQVDNLFHSTTGLERAETQQLLNRLTVQQFDAIKGKLSASQLALLPDNLFARIDIIHLGGYKVGRLLDVDSQDEAKEIQRRLKLFSREMIRSAVAPVSSATLRAYLKELFPSLTNTEMQKLWWLNDNVLLEVFLDAVFLNKRPQFLNQQGSQSSQSYFNTPTNAPSDYQKRISEAKPLLMSKDDGMSEKYIAFKNKIRQSTPPTAKELLGFAAVDQITKELVKRKWQQGSMVVHPDRLPEDRRPEATTLFNCLTAAYDELNEAFN